MYTIVYAEVWINGDTHGEVMSDISAKQWCPLSPTMFGSYIDELETYFDEIDKVSLCLFNTVIAIILYVDDIFFSFWIMISFTKTSRETIWILHFFYPWHQYI